jgi:hypothetical protein
LAKDTLQKVTGKALKEFLAIVQQELEVADVPEGELARYITPLKQFVKDDRVKGVLGSAFAENGQHFYYGTLSRTWQGLNLLALPDDFNWESVGKLKKWVTNDDNSDVRYAAVSAIAQGWKDDPDTLERLER